MTINVYIGKQHEYEMEDSDDMHRAGGCAGADSGDLELPIIGTEGVRLH
jgi:hypothetical protein